MANQKPILFSAPMVRAILEGRKTQTRRVIKWPIHAGKHGFLYEQTFMAIMGNKMSEYAPYRKGDLLWVRETWQHEYSFSGHKYRPGIEVFYKSDYDDDDIFAKDRKWIPSIHMPKAVARIWLEVTNVRVERVQEISDSDAEAEGFKRNDIFTALGNFLEYWDQLNEKRGYGVEVNPWVWVYEFKKVEAPDAESNQ